MDSRYPLLPMSDFLRLRREFFAISDEEEYQLVTVQLHARGIKERSRLLGEKIKTKRQQQIKANDLLVVEIDAKVGGYEIVPADLEGAIVSSHYFLYEVDTNQANSRYLEYYLKSGYPEQDVGQFVKGSVNYAAIRPYHFPQLQIPLPPLDEQRRIVARIEAVAKRVEEALSLQREAINETESLLKASLYSIFNPNTTPHWQETRLDDLAEIVSGVTLGRKSQGPSVTVPYLRVANVQDGWLDLSEVKEIPIRPSELDKWQLKFGDLVLTEGGDLDKLGRGTVWRDEIPVCVHQNHIFRVRLDQNRVLPDFLELEIRSPYGKDYFLAKAKRTTNLASINQTQLRAFSVRYLSSL